MITLSDYIRDKSLRIVVKPGKRENKIISYDDERKAVIVEIKAPAQDNKANAEVVKYFSKILKKQARIKSGFTAKEKIIVFN